MSQVDSESKAGSGSSIREILRAVDEGDGCGEDSSDKGGRMVNEMSGKRIAWVQGLGSKKGADAKSVRENGERGRGDATWTCAGEVGGERSGGERCAVEKSDGGRAGEQRSWMITINGTMKC